MHRVSYRREKNRKRGTNMIRKMIKIDEEKCNGCGLCVNACKEGAIGLVNGKAKLLREDYCDGLGNCLPICPVDAISFEEREAKAFDGSLNTAKSHDGIPQGERFTCPGSRMHRIRHDAKPDVSEGKAAEPSTESQLNQWPVQIQLVSPNAPYFKEANLLIAADCTAYAYGAFHDRFMKGRITLIGCPKLDETDYAEKLAAILEQNRIKCITVVRMEVPCCGGIVHAVLEAMKKSGRMIPWNVVTIGTDGSIIETGL